MPAIAAAAWTACAALLASACATDLRARLIPNWVVAALAGAWALWKLFEPAGAGDGLLAALVYGGGLLAFTMAFEALTRKSAMGGGDLKLIAACALWLGMQRSALCLLLACALSIPLALIIPRTRFACADEKAGSLPFAPAIAAGFAIALLLPVS